LELWVNEGDQPEVVFFDGCAPRSDRHGTRYGCVCLGISLLVYEDGVMRCVAACRTIMALWCLSNVISLMCVRTS
jgi:hypothetical protein